MQIMEPLVVHTVSRRCLSTVESLSRKAMAWRKCCITLYLLSHQHVHHSLHCYSLLLTFCCSSTASSSLSTAHSLLLTVYRVTLYCSLSTRHSLLVISTGHSLLLTFYCSHFYSSSPVNTITWATVSCKWLLLLSHQLVFSVDLQLFNNPP